MEDGVLRARRLEITDDEGRVRIRLSAGSEEMPGVHVLSSRGHVAVSVGINPRTDEPYVALKDTEDEAEIILAIKPSRQHVHCGLSLVDRRGRERMFIALGDEGEPIFGVLDEEGNVSRPEPGG
ncbi:hypothetical protein RxyAA322_30180 [Rubrobacter xylanophilus]|uniref:Uncharacterized protein n=1 Tax=Rubrobacter xylanophilus TaxID=49319 RepID=A0A510HML4_9ACTN|nr:hypothetical protein [Rubrobacter xylanophilus]BBL81164.1 hypothetical protein RxyAA322_30180 [Rubrobacter xylanophilus]